MGDEDWDLRDWNDVWSRIVSFAEPTRHVVLGKELPRPLGRPGEMDFIPPKQGMGIDATREHKETEFPTPPPSKPTMEILQGVAQRWDELGLPEITPQEPWFGYSMGEWSEEQERFAQMAVDGDYFETGKILAQRRRKDVTMTTEVRGVPDEPSED